MLRIGVLTGGGDCPGLNAVIRAIVKRSEKYGFEVVGVKHGWAGMLEREAVPLRYDDVADLLKTGGTILKTSRTNPMKRAGGPETILENMKKMGLDALIAIGGEDTLGAANQLAKRGLKVVGVPKTIDNDLSATDVTFGFDTAVNIATEAIDRIVDTARSHDRVMVVEVMGRHVGWITIYAGMAGGADLILIPEEPFDIEEVADFVKRRMAEGKATVVVVAEGATMKNVKGLIAQDKRLDEFGHVRLGGIGQFLAEEIEKRTGAQTRATVLGYILRGGSPSTYDRVLATRFGVAAVDLVKDGKFGMMVSLRGTKIVPVELEKAVAEIKTVDSEFLDAAKTFFG